MKIDRYGESAAGLGFGHFMCHRDKFFELVQPYNLANGTTAYLELTTGAREVHLRLRLHAAGVVAVTLYESPSGISGGSFASPFNRNRRSSATPTMQISTGVACTTPGTGIYLGSALGTSTAPATVALASSLHEWDDELILQPSKNYILGLLTGAQTANVFDVDLQWYELESNNKNP